MIIVIHLVDTISTMIKTFVFITVKSNEMYSNALKLGSVNGTVFLGNRILSN